MFLQVLKQEFINNIHIYCYRIAQQYVDIIIYVHATL